MIAQQVTVRNPYGLHARPAREFVEAAVTHAAGIRVRKGEKSVSGKSILGLLTLGVKCGDVVTLEIDDDNEPLLARLAEIVGRQLPAAETKQAPTPQS
jgi:phosphocarrier protein HPr